MKPESILKVYNPMTRKYETLNDEDELVIGQTAIIMHWCGRQGRYVTIPDASIVKKTSSGWNLVG